MSKFGCDEFRVIQSRNDVAMAGQVIRQECVASPAAASARMREKDDRANSNRFRWTPDVAREAPVAGGVERLHAPLVNSESARDKWVVSQLVNDTSFPPTECCRLCEQKRVSRNRIETENEAGRQERGHNY